MMNTCLTFQCDTEEHQNEIASFYCLQQQCLQKPFHCALCFGSTHKNHKNRPIKFFWNQIQRDKFAIENSICLLAKIDSLKQQIANLCISVSDHHYRQLLNSSVHQFFIKVDQQCKCKTVLQISKSVGQNLRSNSSQIKELFKIYCSSWQRNNEEDQSTNPNFIRTLRILNQNMKQKYQSLNEALGKGDIGLNLPQIFTQNNSIKKFYFSPKLMHSGLVFVDKNKVKIANYADYNYFALCEPQLSMNKIQTVNFKMISLSSYVTVGICKKNKIEGNYEFMSSGLGHGSFQVSYDGYTWSDTDSSINEQYSGWYYNQGDTVTIQFNPKTKKLKFIRNLQSSNSSTHQMPFQYQKGDKLHFCVSLNSEPEEIQITL